MKFRCFLQRKSNDNLFLRQRQPESITKSVPTYLYEDRVGADTGGTGWNSGEPENPISSLPSLRKQPLLAFMMVEAAIPYSGVKTHKRPLVRMLDHQELDAIARGERSGCLCQKQLTGNGGCHLRLEHFGRHGR